MGEVIVITSGKGGVGKTTTTANIGIGLSRLGKKVIVIDTDLGLRNLDVVMGLENRIIYNLVDVIEGSCRLKQAIIRDKRYPELYLMKAEALAQQGNESGAKEVLNTLLAARTREGVAPLTCDTYSSMAGMSALDMVKLQTRIEMWGERGVEWYNNIRWGIPVNRSGSTVHHNPALTYPAASMTLLIPDQEMQTNNLCVQH